MSMYRRVLLVGLAFVITGAVPLIANFGSCVDMPCCQPMGKVLDQAKSDCCSPATCVKEEKVLRAYDAGQRHLPKQLPVAPHLSLTALTPSCVVQYPICDSPPRTTSERLSALSVLLI